MGFGISVALRLPSSGSHLYVYGESPPDAVGLPPITTQSPTGIAMSGPASAVTVPFPTVISIEVSLLSPQRFVTFSETV